MQRREHSRLTCAQVLHHVAHLLSSEEIDSREMLLESLRQFVDDMRDGKDGAVALHNLAYDQTGGRG